MLFPAFFGFYFVLFLHKWMYNKLRKFSEHSAETKDSQPFECTMISFISNWPISMMSISKAKSNKVFKYLHKQMLIQMKVVTLPKLNCWLTGIHQLTCRSPDSVFESCLRVAIHNVHVEDYLYCECDNCQESVYFLIWQFFLLRCYYETIMAVPWLRQLVAWPLLRTGFSPRADYVTCSGQSGSETVFFSVYFNFPHQCNYNPYS